MNHLSDTEIQDYFDGNLKSRTDEINGHLDQCPICRKKAREYELLFGQLKADSTPVLSPNFAYAVTARIETESTVAQKSDLTYLLYISCTVIGFGLMIYFIGLEKIAKFFSFSMNLNFLDKLAQATIQPIANYLNVDISFVILIGLVLIVIGALDYVFRHQRHKTVSYMFL